MLKYYLFEVDEYEGVDFVSEPHASYKGKRIDIDAVPERSITLEEWKDVRANTWGFEKLYSKLSDSAFFDVLDNHLKNSSGKACGTYDYSIENNLIPEMRHRMELYSMKKAFDKTCRRIVGVIMMQVPIIILTRAILEMHQSLLRSVIEIGSAVLIYFLLDLRQYLKGRFRKWKK
ncbi:MAG: hypothetical protein K0Q47_62 [Sedimentibacter sp.]|jgi:hypothetical protein|nr:hypothetical protein [Sedimentibacter sp.]